MSDGQKSFLEMLGAMYVGQVWGRFFYDVELSNIENAMNMVGAGVVGMICFYFGIKLWNKFF